MAKVKAFFRHPGRLIPFLFMAVILSGALLLMLPVASAGARPTHFSDALFTATSAVSVTGLVTVDTPVHWTWFGQFVIMLCFQIGGFGIMTSAVLMALLVTHRLGLRTKLATRMEVSQALSLGDFRAILLRTIAFSLIVEALMALALTARFSVIGYGLGDAVWYGIYHSVSAFNNAGFALFSDSLMQFATDPWICVPIALGSILGALGMPVIYEVTRRHWGRRQWSVHTKLTLVGSAILIVGGWAAFLAIEWANPATFGQWAWYDRILPAFFQSAMVRASGFNSVDIGAMQDDSQLASIILAFIGGGSASTAGGIKVTTFFLLLLVIWAEVRGEPDVTAFRHRIDPPVVREALTVALVYVACNAFGVFLMQRFEPHIDITSIMFEVTSAFATMGQSTGITYDLSDPSKWLLTIAMYTGRVGPVLFAASLALRARKRLYRYPSARPLVG
ncbi:TrkH family potassium uptake protein [Glycomyces albidus]|jgi:potassium uptake TrkH family protein|uniref:TrkH family potassium uptake protein n=1 Tax=Glycomyces albidus TaxID=2656774 RepID=A0A6L5G6M1_9ACTN|nr:potassium transporter TrkG [Glycomyces albidus]MQM25281.1 TrkH family potassium uptake protein [Glycomyces albidus]